MFKECRANIYLYGRIPYLDTWCRAKIMQLSRFLHIAGKGFMWVPILKAAKYVQIPFKTKYRSIHRRCPLNTDLDTV